MGNVLYRRNRQRDALACFDRAVSLAPGHRYVIGQLARSQAKLCQWEDHAGTMRVMREGVQARKTCVSPFVFLGVCDDPREQRLCAEIYTRDLWPQQSKPETLFKRPANARDIVRFAYVSPDFRNHPVSFLMAELIERHDRSRFEVFGVSIGPEARDPWRERLKAGFDHFLEMQGCADQVVADRLRALEIDIAVDLAGHTTHNRAGIFAARSAPIQVNYLGFPGTTGADFLDYILADRFVIPEPDEVHYSEKVVCLPHSFQCSPPREMPRETPERSDLGLPDDGFIFCCFNKTYKIGPAVFDAWMRVLSQVEGSVLWLLKANDSVESNLRREAASRGVDPDRLIFAPHLPLAQYLARYRQADLFLDTVPYNAGTTASDALWAGVPVLNLLRVVPLQVAWAAAFCAPSASPILSATICRTMKPGRCIWRPPSGSRCGQGTAGARSDK